MIGRCNVCGTENIDVHIIKDKNFSPLPTNELLICDNCHKLIIEMDHSKLLDVIFRKLGGVKQ
jgi:hypothetical protein